MKLKNRIEDVFGNFAVLTEGSVMCSGAKASLRLHKDETVDILSENEFRIQAKVRNEVWTFDQTLTRSLIYDSEKKSKSYLDFIFSPVAYEDMHIEENIVCIVREHDRHFFGKINLFDKSINAEYPLDYGGNGISYILKNGTFLSKGKDFLTCCRLSDGEIVWQTEYRDLTGWENARLFEKIFSFSGRIFIHIQGGLNMNAYCLNEIDGKLIKVLDDFKGMYQIYADTVYTAGGHSLQFLTESNFDLQVYDFKETFKEKKISIYAGSSILSNDGILYFIDGLRSSDRFGAIDIRTKKLLVHEKVKISSSWKKIDHLELHNNLLYVHSDDNSLSIYV